MDLLHYYYDSEESDNESAEETASIPVLTASQCPPDLFERSRPHTIGCWSGHVHIDIDLDSTLVETAVAEFRNFLTTSGYRGPLVVGERWHLSLSRDFYLQEANIESLVDQLRDRLSHHAAFGVRVTSRATLLSNDDQTRSFWCLHVPTTRALTGVVAEIDAVLERYGLPKYYEPAEFHVSVASIPGVVDATRDVGQQPNCRLVGQSVWVEEIRCTFGSTKSIAIALRSIS